MVGYVIIQFEIIMTCSGPLEVPVCLSARGLLLGKDGGPISLNCIFEKNILMCALFVFITETNSDINNTKMIKRITGI